MRSDRDYLPRTLRRDVRRFTRDLVGLAASVNEPNLSHLVLYVADAVLDPAAPDRPHASGHLVVCVASALEAMAPIVAASALATRGAIDDYVRSEIDESGRHASDLEIHARLILTGAKLLRRISRWSKEHHFPESTAPAVPGQSEA